MLLSYLLLFLIWHATVSLTSVGDLHIAEPLKNQSIPLFISDDPSMSHLVKLNAWINNANHLHLYRKRRSMSSTAAINTSVTSVDDELFYKPELEAPWHLELIGAPQSVLFLGQLIIASSVRGFSLQDGSSNSSYKYIRNPISSHATMLQITNEAFNAFYQAHRNMNSIQMSMRQIPYLIKDALIITYYGSRNYIARYLPRRLTAIKTLSENALKAATETHSAFANVMLLIGEVLEEVGAAKYLSEEKLQEIKRQLAMSQKMLDESMKMKEFIHKELERTRSKMKQMDKQYSNALKKIPTGYEALFQDFTRDMLGAVVDVAKIGLKMLIFGKKGAALAAISDDSNKEQPSGSGIQGKESSLIHGKVFAEKLGQILPIVDQLLSRNGKKTAKSANEFETYKKALEFHHSNINNSKSNGTMHRVKEFVEKGIKLAGRVVNFIRESNSSSAHRQPTENAQQNPDEPVQGQENEQQSESPESLREQFHQLNDKAQPYAVANSLQTGDPAKNVFNDHTPTGNAKFLAALASERVRDAEQRYDQRYEDFKQAQTQCSQLMAHIAGLDFTKVDLQQIITVINDILGILGNLREQWAKLMIFFADLQTLIESELFFVEFFISEQKGIMEDNSLLQTDGKLINYFLRRYTLAIHQATYLVYIMSRTYVDVSRRYVVSQVAGLSKFSTATTNEERNRLKNELYRAAQDAQNHITSLVDERKRQYHQAIDQKRKELNELLGDLGGLTNFQEALIEDGKIVAGLPMTE